MNEEKPLYVTTELAKEQISGPMQASSEAHVAVEQIKEDVKGEHPRIHIGWIRSECLWGANIEGDDNILFKANKLRNIKRQILDYAVDMLKNGKPSQVIVHAMSGKRDRIYDIKNKPRLPQQDTSGHRVSRRPQAPLYPTA